MSIITHEKFYPDILELEINEDNLINIATRLQIFKVEFLEKLITESPDTINIVAKKGFSFFVALYWQYPEVAKKYLSNLKEDTLKSKFWTANGISMNNLTALCVLTSVDEEFVTELLNTDTVQTSLIEEVDNFGNSVLMYLARYKPRVLRAFIKHPKITKEVFQATNNQKQNILLRLLMWTSDLPHRILVYRILEHEYFTEEMMNQIDVNGVNSLILACKCHTGVVNKIINHQFFKSEMFTQVDVYGRNCFMEACQSKNLELVKSIISNDLFTKEIFQSKDKNGKPGVLYALESDSYIAEFILTHEFCTKEIFDQGVEMWLKNDIEGIDYDKLNILLKSKYCDKDFLLKKDNNGYNILVLVALTEGNQQIVRNILNSPNCCKELIEDRDNSGNNIIQLLIQKKVNNNLIDDIVDCTHFDPDMVLNKNSDGHTCLYNLVFSRKTHSILKILSRCQDDTLVKTIYDGEHALIHQPVLIDKILAIPYITKETLLQKTSDGQTILHILACMITSNLDGSEQLNAVLESEKCSTELVNTVDESGRTFLQINPDLWDDFKCSIWCTPEFMANTDTLGSNLLISFMDDTKMVAEVLNHESASKELIIGNPKAKFTPLMVAMEIQTDVLDIILESECCDTECVNSQSSHKLTPLSYGILRKCHTSVKKLLDSEYDLTESFTNKDSFGRNPLMLLASSTDTEMFELVFNCNYITKEMVMEKNNYGHTVLTYMVNRGLNMLKVFANSKYWIPEVIFNKDIDNDFLMLYPYRDPEVVGFLADDPVYGKELVKQKNRLGLNCAHTYAEKNHESLRVLLESVNFDENLLAEKSLTGDTPLHTACKHNPKSINVILDSNNNIKGLLKIQNKRGENPLMLIFKYNPSSAHDVIKSGACTVEMFEQVDCEGRSTFAYAVMYGHRTLKNVIDLPIFNKEWLELRDNDQQTPIMLGCRFNHRSVKTLVDNNLAENHTLTIGHTDYGSVLTIAARYQPEAVKHILKKKDIEWKILHAEENGDNFIKIACTFNAIAVKYAINSKYDLSDFFNLVNDEPAIITASKYQPDAVKYILGSKYAVKDMFMVRVKNRNCVDNAYNFQPKALRYMVESDIATHDMLNQEDNIGYRLTNKLRKAYNISTLDDIKKINLTEHNNDPIFDDDDPQLCNICYSYRTKVVFNPCSHVCCVGCAFKLRDCHICRQRIESKNLIY